MKNVLVTGASGALGAVVASRFEKKPGCEVVRTGLRSSTARNYFNADLTVRSEVENVLLQTRPDLIVHLAGNLSNDFESAVAVNVNAARYILEAVEKYRISARVVLMGSAAEYGVVDASENPVKESRMLAPVSVYGMSKSWQTMLMGVYVQRGLDVVVARGFNFEGPGLSERLIVGRVERMIAALKKGEIDKIHLGPLSAIRDYISFEEASEQIEAISIFGATGSVYHVASGIPITIRDIVKKYMNMNNIDFDCVEEDISHSNRGGYDVPVIYADVSRTKALLLKSAT